MALSTVGKHYTPVLHKIQEAIDSHHISFTGCTFFRVSTLGPFLIVESKNGRPWRCVERVTRPMLGFKSFAAAQDTLVGIELMHMLKKRQMVVEEGDESLTAAELCYSLAA